MREGLYKVEVQTAHGQGRGVAVVREGKIFGGNAAFAAVGEYRPAGADITLDISTLLRNRDLNFTPVAEFARVTLQGRRNGEPYLFENSTAAINAVMTEISEEAAPPAGTNSADGVRNGLYSLNIRMLDGIDSGNTGLMVLHDGTIRGGDAFFDYVGAYSSANGRWKGELINHTHTPTRGARPLFGGREVGIGFSGTYNDQGAEGEATALAGKRSIRFKAVLRKLVEIEG